MMNNKIPEPKVAIFQINDVSAFPGIDKYRVGYVITHQGFMLQSQLFSHWQNLGFGD